MTGISTRNKGAGRLVAGRGHCQRRGVVALSCLLVTLCLLLLQLQTAQAQQTPRAAQARILTDQTVADVTSDSIDLQLALSQPVPFRLRLLSLPPRLVLDVNTLDWSGLPAQFVPVGGAVRAVRMGHLPDGWARLVLDLGGPFVTAQAAQTVDPDTGQAMISLVLNRSDLDLFESRAVSEAQFLSRLPGEFLHAPEAPAAEDTAAQPGNRQLPVVMLDPGHGGIDPGAERDGVREADLVLAFGRLLREELIRRGNVDVATTRDADVFVSLDGRIRAARAAQADLFISLHADALPEGMASGAVVYLLGDEASDESAAYLAQRHDRADLLAGADLTRASDDIARVLMSVAWQDTAPRSRALAEELVEAVGAAGLRLHRRPVQAGAFSVLRAPDMPSVLIELGFMSSPRDMANLRDSAWNARMVNALADAVEAWIDADRAQEGLRRR